jgi:transglutaminase-like putative cysteine protease
LEEANGRQAGSLETEIPVKRFILASGAVSAAVLAFVLSTPSARAEDPKPATRTFSYEYVAKVPAPEGAKRLDVWVPLPIEDELQKVADLKVEATVAGASVKADDGKDDVYGNRFAHVGADAPKGEVMIKWTATITRTADSGQGKGPVVDRYKQADELVPITGRASDLAKEILGEKPAGSVGDQAKKIYDNVLTTMTYDKTGDKWGRGDFEYACDVGKGNCTDFHAKFTGIARAAGIPVRFTMGASIPTDAPKGVQPGYHCWAHYHDGKSWVPVDISDAQRISSKDPAKAQWFYGHLDADRMALTVGRDINLAPKQQGGPVPFMAFPYAEADGKVLKLEKTSRAFAYENK